MKTALRPLENGCWDLLDDTGEILIAAESYAVCAAIQEALTRADRWEPTEAYEIADQIRRRRADGA